MKYLLMVELTSQQIGFIRDMFGNQEEFADNHDWVKDAVSKVVEACDEVLS